MTPIDILGIDIATNVFQRHGAERRGWPVVRRQAMHDRLLEVLHGLEPYAIAIEACTGAVRWARRFEVTAWRSAVLNM